MLQKSAHDSAPLWPADYSSFPRYVMTSLLGSWREASVMADCLFITSGLGPRHPVPPHSGLRTEARPAGVSLGCQQIGDTHLNLSTFQRGSLCVQISTVWLSYWIILTTKLSQLCFWARFPLICMYMLKNLILFIVLVSFNSPGYDAIPGNFWPTSCLQTWSVFLH